MTDYPNRGFKDLRPERDQWKREGIELAQRHDATVWEIGDWGLRGRQISAQVSVAGSSKRRVGKA